MRKFSTWFTIFTFLFIGGLVYSLAQPRESGWTIETLKEYFERRFVDLETAVRKAEEELKVRFAGVNEFRGTLEDQQRTFMLRLEQEVKDKSQDEKIQANTDAIAKIESLKQGGDVVWAYILGGGGFIFGIVSLMFNYQKRVIK